MFLASILYLINVVFDIYTIILIIRLVLAWVGADSNHRLIQAIITVTSPVVRPLKKFLPDKFDIEFSTLVVIILLQAIKWLLIFVLSPGFGVPNIIGVLIVAVSSSLSLLLQVLFYAILLQFILSLIQPNAPFYRELSRFTSPALRPVQKLVPPISGIDISPIIVCVIIQLINMVVVTSLMAVGTSIAIIGFK